MATMIPALGAGTATEVGNAVAGDASKTLIASAQLKASMDKESADKTLALFGG